ncbi:MAG: acyl-CoA synthetase [Pseudomonadota bacterium]|nr:acyl-CoA synthetase [Pseudomonadota bacterium]
MDMNFANLWEQIADAVPERTALAHGDCYRSWKEYDDRAARIAQFLSDQGLGKDAKAALYSYNSNEYLEAQYAIFKIRGCPINVNYRYMEDELIYLLDNSDSQAVFYQGIFAERIEAIRDKLPDLKVLVQIDDGSGAPLLEGAHDFESIVAGNTPMQRIERAYDDLYMLYTGGTTGMPKGVMYNNGEMCGGLAMGFEQFGFGKPEKISDIVDAVKTMDAENRNPVSLVACPLMHGTGVWLGAFMPHHMGGKVVTVPNRKFDAHLLWEAVQREGVNMIVIVGDAFARPMLDALNEAKAAGKPYDISSVFMITSSGVMWTHEVKRGLLEHHDMLLVDNLGATEGGMARSITTRADVSETAKFVINENSKVFTDDGREVQPGSGEVGRVANGGFCPIGYYKDPKKSAETFKEIDGHRYSFPGDYATVEQDGTIKLLGRGSMCINTMGEKVYPEEVEEAIKKHPAVYDCLVAGVKDPKFGERVTAVVSLTNGARLSEDELNEYLRDKIAGYKRPKNVFFVDEVRRATNGKADYKWAKAKAAEEVERLTA